jgi:hypothetical protein
MSASDAGWAKAGEMLQDRRVELDMRYSNLRLFTDEQGINYRLAWDAEHGARTNYRRPALTSIEVAYGLKRGSFLAAVNGGEIEPAPGTPGAGPPPDPVTPDVLDKLEDFIRFSRGTPAGQADGERAGNGA